MSSKPKSKEFVEDSSDASDGGTEPKPKKAKKVKAKIVEEEEQQEDQDDEGPPFELGARKKISVNSFKGKTLVDIREYYDAGGEEKPGKRGISLTLEQWKKLKKFIPKIDKELSNQ